MRDSWRRSLKRLHCARFCMAWNPFTPRRMLVLLAALLAMGTIAWWANRGPREPVLEGKKLSWWFTQGIDQQDSATVQRLTADQLRSLGPGALDWLCYRATQTSVWDMKRPDSNEGWMRRTSWWLRENWFEHSVSRFERIRFEAIAALAELGPEAPPAIPALVKAIRTADHDGSLVATDALIGMGPVSWPAIRDAMKNGDSRTRGLLLYKLDGRWAYQRMQDDPQEFADTVALLVPPTIAGDKYWRQTAARQLKACGTAWQAQPRVAEGIALVAASLAHDPEPVRRATVRFLSSFEEQAAIAIPALTALAEASDELTRIEVAGALCLIEPNNSRWPKQLRELATSPNKEVAEAAENALIHAGK